jgi:hypothetical protein
MKTILNIITLTVGIIFSGCSLSSKKTETTTKSTAKTTIETNRNIEYDNFETTFDSLKFKFKKGDRIVINGWLLLGPKTFFDSISIDKNLFKGRHVKKNNASALKYGYWGNSNNIYELRIPDMDILPYGDFLDINVCEYLVPNEQIFYFLDGAPCESYSKVLDRIKNYGIKNIQKVDAKGATKIWGTHYGKNGALIIDIDLKIHAQYMFRPFDTNNIFSKIIKIDSVEYYSKKVNAGRMDKPTTIKKEKGIIKIPSGNSTIVFRDDKRDESFIEYTAIGQNLKHKWVLIKAEDYNQDYYYLVNQIYNKIDTLSDTPQIYGAKFLCGQGGSADGYPAYVEIWDTQNGKLNRILKFKWESYGLDIRKMYLRKDTLFIKNYENKYLKMRI